VTTATAPPLAVQSVAYAGLDTLLLAVPLDLCAYLHVGEELGPQLYLRRPTLGGLDPAEAFQLFSSLRDLLDDPAPDVAAAKVGAFDAAVGRSSGPRSRGLWVVGSRGGPLPEAQVEVARAIGDNVMAVCHAAEALRASPTTVVPPSVERVAVETTDAGLRAEVSVIAAGGVGNGSGTAASALAAVAIATLAAIGSDRKLVAAEEDGIGETRVVLVLTMDEDGRLSVGSAIAEGGPLAAAADAALLAAA
jgi:hypothetical protein